MHDAFRMNLMQAHQKISRYDLDVAEVESFTTVYEILE